MRDKVHGKYVKFMKNDSNDMFGLRIYIYIYIYN